MWYLWKVEFTLSCFTCRPDWWQCEFQESVDLIQISLPRVQCHLCNCEQCPLIPCPQCRAQHFILCCSWKSSIGGMSLVGNEQLWGKINVATLCFIRFNSIFFPDRPCFHSLGSPIIKYCFLFGLAIWVVIFEPQQDIWCLSSGK